VTFLSIDIDLMRWIEELSGPEQTVSASNGTQALSM